MTNEQLLMLDSLVYFSKFSNNFTPKSDGTFYSVGDFVNAALANPNDYETCFNGALGYNDGDLGMYDILGLVKEDPELMSLKIVYPQTADDHTTNSVCLINSWYPPNNPVSLQKAKRQGHQALPLIISITKS